MTEVLIKTRDIVETDAENIAKMHATCFRDAWTADMMRGSIEQKGFFGGITEAHRVGSGEFCGEASNNVVCTVMFSSVGDEAELLSVVTAESFRKKGYAEELLSVYLKKLEAANIKAVFLEVRESNASAIKLYCKLGFIKIAERKKYYGDETAVIMKKEF